MMTPEEKYNNDPMYHNAVEHMESFIHNATFTPSELREIVMLACIHYEMKQTKLPHVYPLGLRRPGESPRGAYRCNDQSRSAKQF